MTEQNQQHKDLLSGWNQEDRKQIISVVLPLIEMQKAYGRTLDIKLVMSGWEMILASKYNADQICYALKEYALTKEDFPTPASINNILNPPKPEITQAEYVAAKDWQKRNDYPIFSEALDVIKAYEEQEKSKRVNFKSNNEKLNAIAKQTAEMLSAK